MRIDGHVPLSATVQGGKNPAARADGSRLPSGSASEHDEARFSSTEFLRAATADFETTRSPEFEKVTALQAAMREGSYRPDPSAIAAAMLRDLF